MRKLLLTFLLLLLTSPISYEASAHNIAMLDVDQATSSTILIRQVESHLEMWGVNSSNYFQIQGSGNTINIDMQSEDSGCCNYITGGWTTNSNSSLTILLDGDGSDHLVNFDYDYSGTSNYHHVDVAITGSGHTNKVYIDDSDVDHSNTSLEIDIKGSGGGNTVYATVGGTQAAQKIYIDGGSNTVYSFHSGIGDLATGRTALYESTDAATYTNWIYITGSSNTVRTKSIDTSKTKITISGTGNHKISGYTDVNGWLINTNGGIIDLTIAGTSNNRIGYTGSGSGNTATISLTASNQTGASVDLLQSGGDNSFTLTVTGSSIHQYTPKFTQTGGYTYCATVNLDNLSSSNSSTTTNASGGC